MCVVGEEESPFLGLFFFLIPREIIKELQLPKSRHGVA